MPTFFPKDFSTRKWQGVRKKCFPDFSARTNRAYLSGARRAEKSGKQIPFLRTNLKKTFFKFEPIWKRLFSNWFVGDLQICCHFQHKTARPTSKQMVKTNTFPICFPKMFSQLVPSLSRRFPRDQTQHFFLIFLYFFTVKAWGLTVPTFFSERF